MIHLKSPKEIETMKEGGKILSEIISQLQEKVSPGITTNDLNRLAESLLFKFGKPSFKGYQGFPASLCTSIDDEIVHGLPSNRVLREGEMISLDIGLLYNGYHTDMAVTLGVGKIDLERARLIRAAKKALKRGIKKAQAGKTFGDISEAIQRHTESQGFTVIKNFCGHGIGKEVHEDPQILNFGKKKSGPKIREGMVFCIEPIIGNGSAEAKKSEDGFTYKTADGSLSAQFEHTVAITSSGTEILTATF